MNANPDDLVYNTKDIRRDLAKLLPELDRGVPVYKLDKTFHEFKSSFPALYDMLLTDRCPKNMAFLENCITRMEKIEQGQTTRNQQHTEMGQDLFDHFVKPMVTDDGL